MPQAIDRLIRDAVSEFFTGTEDADSVQRQLNLIAECELHHTGVGFVCDFSVDGSAPQVLKFPRIGRRSELDVWDFARRVVQM